MTTYEEHRAAYFARLLAEWPSPTPEQAFVIRQVFGVNQAGLETSHEVRSGVAFDAA